MEDHVEVEDEDFVLEGWTEGLDEDAEESELENEFESEGEEGDSYDEFGFKNFDIEEGGNLSADEDQETRLMEAGFTNGMKPAPYEIAILSGTVFPTWEGYDEAVHEYEAMSGFRFTRTKKRTEAARGICRGWKKDDPNACRAEISARKMAKTKLITIRKAYLLHTCTQTLHAFRSGANRTTWVARKLADHIRINPNTPINQLKDAMHTFHTASSSPWTVQRARALCREQIHGGSKETFYKIPAYIAAIRKVDPEGHAAFQTGEETRFARLYIAPASSRNAAKFCRPLVGLDGTHTSGKFPMTLLLATCFDAENHIVILAWAVVGVENGDNWCWFCENLRLSYPSFRGANMVFISDRDKGLKLGVREAFPGSNHAHCIQHLRTNIKGTVDVYASKYFKKIVEAKTEDEYEKLLSTYQATNEKQSKFVAYVRKIGPEVYARHAFPAPRYGHYTSNIVEIINAAVKPARVLPALNLSDYIWCYVMERHCERAEHASQLPNGEFSLTQYANNVLNRLYRESGGVKEQRSSATASLMIDNKGKWAASLPDRHCDCQDWKEHDFPCVHAVRFMANRSLEIKEFVGEVWYASTQRQAYSVPVPPMSIDRLTAFIDGDHPCWEPVCMGSSKGKRAAKRKPSWGEQQARMNERLVKKQAQRCGHCRRPGHNKRNCVYGPAPMHGRGRGMPRTTTATTASHETVIVGDTTGGQRATASDSWNLYHVRSTFQTWSEQVAERDAYGTGPSQVTQ